MGVANLWSLQRPRPIEASGIRLAQPSEDIRIARLQRSVEQLERALLARELIGSGDADIKPIEANQDRSRDVETGEVDEPVTADARDGQRRELAGYESRFAQRSEPVDEWARARELDLRSKLTGSPSADVRSIDCRGSLCRVETQHESSEQGEAFLDEDASRSVLMGATFHRYPLDEARTRFVMFVEPSG